MSDYNRKPICRLHFNRSQKYIGIFDEKKNETRIPIQTLDNIFDHAEALQRTVLFYESGQFAAETGSGEREEQTNGSEDPQVVISADSGSVSTEVPENIS